MRDKILEDAKFNTTNEDYKNTRWTKLNSVQDIYEVIDLLSDISKECLEEGKDEIDSEIKQGITFGFYFDESSKLVFER